MVLCYEKIVNSLMLLLKKKKKKKIELFDNSEKILMKWKGFDFAHYFGLDWNE